MGSNQLRVRPRPEHSRLTKIAVFGETGSGKSTLANVLLGLKPHDPEGSSGFKTSPLSTSCTEYTSHIDGHWLGDTTAPAVRFIDIPGHGDSEGRDTELRKDMVNKLKEEQVVHAFIWVKNSQNPRLAEQEIVLLGIMEKVFGQGFAQNVLMVLTRWSFNNYEEEKRKDQGLTLEAYKKDLLEKVPYPHAIAIDALYSRNDVRETQIFVKGVEELRRLVDEMGERPMEDIQMVKSNLESVEEELEKLNKEKEEMEKENIEAQRKIEELADERKRLAEQIKHQTTDNGSCTLL